MGFTITGYVLEAPRVGSSNNPFTPSTADFISDPSAYSAAYPDAETNPRTDYMVLVVADGKLPNALFGWTKNEGLVAGGPAIQRFDFDGKHQRFSPLPGGKPVVVGILGPTSNTTRLKVAVPIGVMAAAPFRLSIGTTGSGITQNVTLVSSFGSPPAGTTELLTTGTAGQLNWNAADLVTYLGQTIRFQQQSPFGFSASNGNLGILGNNTLLLNPIPGHTQYPLLRIGFELYLTSIEKPNEATLSVNPSPGTVEWALTTGLLKFNSVDIAANIGVSVYFDGTLMGANLSLPVQNLGTINLSGNTSPQSSVLSPIPTPGGDIIFRVPGVVQFLQAVAVPVSNFDSVGKQGQVQYDPTTGQVILSIADRIAFGGQPLQMVSGDLPIDHGISMRFFRTPVDLAGTNSALKDVTAIYSVTGAILQSPITQVPLVFLPSTPINSLSYPERVYITQGTGNFSPSDLPNLAAPSPPSGIGYTIDFDKSQLQYAQRNNGILVKLPQATPIAVLPDPLIVTDASRSFALETTVNSSVYIPFTESPPGSGVFTSTSGVGGILDFTAGQFAFTQIAGALLAQGSDGTFDGTGLVFTDTSTDFGVDGVMAGDFLAVLTGTSKGIYSIATVAGPSLTLDLAGTPNETNLEYEVHHSKEVLADRFFEQVELVDPNTRVERIRSLGSISNSPRLQIPLGFINVSRFRFGNVISGHFSSAVVLQPTDGSFTNPVFLAAGSVEVSQQTGNLNFSASDVSTGAVIYWVRQLKQTQDYTITPELGNINFTDRFLALEEALITYTSINDPATVIVESARFLVRKELTQPHPLPVSTLNFNPLGRTVATTPASRVWRGGRPQVIGTQCNVDSVHSTVTFLADAQLTNALPHGAIVKSNENVYVDYYIYEAIGGEKTLNVLQSPMNLAQVAIVAGKTNFVVHGNHVGDFPVGFLLRIGKEQVYQIGSVDYDSTTNLTTVTLAAGVLFTDNFVNPDLYITSGPTRTTGTLFFPVYFVTETAAYDAVARGMNTVKLVGDRTSTYKAGSILLFGVDFYQATGVSYDAPSNRTQVSLARNTVQQYDSQILKYSVRPVFESTTTTVTTNLNPVLTQEIVIWRRIEGQVGQILSSPADYTIDQGGNVKVTNVLSPSEEISIFYTGHITVQAGRRLQASYTNIIAPNLINGLLSQNLVADYSTYSPDTFYFRVESMKNFRLQYAADLQAQATASAPTGGPITSNTASSKLFEQGRASVFFNEVHLANQDIIARSTLVFYNQAVNNLEDALHALDGRVVGDHDGRFKFDGVVGRSVASPVMAQNQIDDLVLVSPFPLPNGTRQRIYLQGPYSRFFKTRRNIFTTSPVVISGSGNDGDVIAKFTFTNLSSLPAAAFKRKPRAQIQYTYPPGTTTFVVDNATGTNDALQRPAFVNSMRVVIEDPAHTGGSAYIPDSQHSTVVSMSAGPPQTITISSGAGQAIPAGATIYVAPSDANSMYSDGNDPPPVPGSSGAYMMAYPVGKDMNVNLGTGEALYVKRKFPFDGTLPTTFMPKFLYIYPVQPGDTLQCDGAGVFNTDVAPYKSPALYGGTTDDDGDQALPMVGPAFDGEVTTGGGGPLNAELLAYQTASPGPLGQLYTVTTPPYAGTGSLNVARTIITDANASFPSPIPKVNDLVRILDGLNGATTFHRISAVGVNALTVDSSFSVQDSNFHYTVTVSALTISGTCTLAGTILTDSLASFTTNGTTPGFTVVVTSGPNSGHRRQVLSITDAHDIVLDQAFPSATGGTYRIDNPLDTFNGFPYTSVAPALAAEVATVGTAEQNALHAFFATVFTTIVNSTLGSVLTGNLSQLVDTSVDFIAAGITTSNLAYIQTGSQMGVFKIVSVDDSHHLTISVPFPGGAGTGITYQLVSAFGAGYQTFQDLVGLLAVNGTFLAQTQTFQTLWNMSVAVNIGGVVDANAFAYGVQTSDLQARAGVVNARASYLHDPANGPIAKIQNVLSGTERLYDKRYTWIDARINQQKGLLVQEVRAISDRIAAQADILAQLIKLLAVQS